MSTYDYHEILNEVLNQVQHLTPDDQRRLLKDLEALVRPRDTEQPLHSVMEFEGVGKELWKGVDVEKYIDDERNSWDG
jgi:hypothetical protein